MSNPNQKPDPTADWRKYPKSPNFLGIVIGASIFMLVAFVVAYILLHHDASKMLPHGPNPTPNSLMRPLLPDRPSPLAV
jgi:hypothetical protein